MLQAASKKVLDEGLNIAKTGQNNVMSFVIFIVSIISTLIGVLATVSTLPSLLNQIIIGILVASLLALIGYSFFKAIISPQTMIFNQQAIIIAQREKLFDNDNPATYYSNDFNNYGNDNLLEENHNIKLNRPKVTKKKIEKL